MLDFLFPIRAAIAYRRLTGINWSDAWGMAGAMVEWRADGYSLEEAVCEDISYWVD